MVAGQGVDPCCSAHEAGPVTGPPATMWLVHHDVMGAQLGLTPRRLDVAQPASEPTVTSGRQTDVVDPPTRHL